MQQSFFVFKYLIEVLGISMRDCYKELLILSNFDIFTEYIEAKLAEIGIRAFKKDLDQIVLERNYRQEGICGL